MAAKQGTKRLYLVLYIIHGCGLGVTPLTMVRGSFPFKLQVTQSAACLYPLSHQELHLATETQKHQHVEKEERCVCFME